MSNVKLKDGTTVDFEIDDDIEQLFLETVPDNAMRSLLFETRLDREPDPEVMDFGGYEIIKVMKRILNAAYMIVMCRWKQLKDDTSWGYNDDIAYFDNSRFTKLFQSVLSGDDITLDLQIFSLMELWVDLKEAPSLVAAQFNMIFDSNKSGDNIGLMLQSVRDAVKNATFKNGGECIGKFTKPYCNELCYNLLRSFMIFSGVSIKYPLDNRTEDDKDFAISYKLNYKDEVTLYPNTMFTSGKFVVSKQQISVLCGEKEVKVPNQLVLYMRTETSVFNEKYQNRYSSFDGEKQAFIQTEKKENELLTKDLIKDIHETRKFLSFSYKNIREFAMIINDSIKGADTKRQELFSICKAQYKKIIPCGDNWKVPNIYWDNIITLMMLEMGVSDFLEKIFCEETLFNNVLDNIAWRYKGRNGLDELRKAYRERAEKIKSSRRDDSTAEEKMTYDRQILQLRIKTALKAMNFNTEDDDSKNGFLESLSYKYGKIEACIERLKNGDRPFKETMANVAELQKIFKDIFMFLQMFYSGLDSYSKTLTKKNEEFSAELVAAEADGVITYEEREMIRNMRRNIRKECCRAFIIEAKAKLEKIKKQTASQLFEGFCELCMKYNTFSERGGFDVSEEARRLKDVITRNYICDANKLKYFATVEIEKNSDDNPTIFDVLSNLQLYMDEPQFPRWLTYLQDIFMFLIYNEDYNKRGLWETMKKEPLEDKDCDPIYPYMVTYYKENVDRDNVKKCTYRVPLPTTGSSEGYTVTLLTDEEYLPQTYFCIPLRYGSSDRWWINPFLIPKNAIRDIGYPETKTR